MICAKLSLSLGTSSSAVGSTMKTTSYCLLLLLNFTPPSVELLHCFQRAVPDNHSQCVCTILKSFFHYRLLALCKRVEHKPLRVGNRMLGLNPDAQPDELF